MTDLKQNISIRLLQAGEPVPYPLLLLADPSEAQIDAYLADSELYVAVVNEVRLSREL